MYFLFIIFSTYVYQEVTFVSRGRSVVEQRGASVVESVVIIVVWLTNLSAKRTILKCSKMSEIDYRRFHWLAAFK